MKLLQHQIDVLNSTSNLSHVAYYLDMGLGKTFVGAEKLHQLNAPVNLLICQKSKISDWIEHFKIYYNYDVFDLTDTKQLKQFNHGIGIINYELAWRRKELLKLKDFTLMLDESSLIQNDKAKQSKFVLKLNASNVILLSGTPTGGKYENLWSQGSLLGWNISKKIYESTYINYVNMRFGNQVFKLIDKKNPYKNVDRLKNKLREHGAIFMKTEDVLSLPTQTFIEKIVPAPKEYKQFIKEDIVVIDDEEIIATNTLTKRLYARQICGAYSKSKLQALKDLIDSTDDRLIIFYNFNNELEQIKSVCNDRPLSVVNGSVKDLTAYESEDNSITLVQYQAGSMGLNLQKCNKIIYYTLCERSDLFEQSKKRIHRIGTTQTCFYYVLMCDNTVDYFIYQSLKQKQDFTDKLFQNNCLQL